MKKVLAWVLLLTLVLGAFAGCKQKPEPEVTEPPYTGAGAADAIEYLKGFYNDGGKKTPVDYTRFGIVRVGGVAFDVVWSVDVSEDLVKVVPNEDGTVTIDINEACEEDTEYTLIATVTDAQGNTATHSWTYVLPKGVDMVEVVKSAYALQPGESLPYESRLIGKIISIDAIWTEDYQNVTVTIEVEGAEDMPIKCYRMKANDSTIDAARNLKVGNIITVCGTLKNYEGTIEFDAGCMLEKVEKGDAIDAPTDPVQIVKEAYALPENAALPYQATLTGTVTGIDSPYDPQYGNISVVITIEGAEQYPILCYRLKGTGVDQIAINDLITVTGIIKNYKGTIEYDAGCVMTNRVSGGGVAQGPSSDPNKIIPDALKLAPGEKLPYRATLTGQVYSVDKAYDPNYGNVTVTMLVNGVKIQCYRMVGDGIDQIRESDTITVSGVIENYNGKLEFGAKCNLDSWIKGPRSVNYGPLVEETAYRLFIDQTNLGKKVYFDGTYSGTRLNGTDKGSKGADVFVERVSGKGVRFYFMEGNTKKYIEIEEYLNDKGQARGSASVTATPSCYWVYNSEFGMYIVNLPTAGKYFLGTYNTYDTFSASWIGYIDGSVSGSAQFIAKFMAATDVPADGTSGNTKVEGTAVEEPVVGTGYKFGFHQNKIDGKPFLGFAGKMAGFYYAVSDVMAEMVDVYLEAADGGYYLYTKNGNTKTYLDVVPRDNDPTKVNVVLQTSGTHTVYQLDTEYKYVYTEAVGSEWYLGTYGTNQSISASLTSYIADKSTIGVTQFCAWFSEVEEVEVEEPEATEPEATEPGGNVPAVDAEIVKAPAVGTAYKLGMDKKDGKILYFNGNTADKNYRLATTTNAAEAVDVYLEAADGGYRLYFMNGNAKTYIRVSEYTKDDGKLGGTMELTTTVPAEVYSYDETVKTLIYTNGNNSYYIGTYSTFTTFSVSSTYFISGDKASTIDVSQFPARFYTVGEGSEPETTEPEATEPEATEPSTGSTALKNGDKVVIYAPAYNKALSAEKTGNYNVGVDITISGGEISGYGETEIWTVTANNDGTYSFANGGKNISMGDQYTSMNLGLTYDDWALISLGNSLYNIQNTGRETFMEWYAKFSNWSTYGANNAAKDDQFQLSIYVIGEGILGEEGEEPEVTEPEATEPEATEPVTGEGFNKVTSAAQFTSGKYVMIVSTGYAPGAFDNGWLSAVQPVVSGNQVTDTKDAVWTLTVKGDSVVITDASGVAIAPKGGNNNGVSEKSYDWTWTFDNGTFRFAGVDADTVVLASNATTTGQYPGNNRFRGYKTKTVSDQPENYPCDFTLYKLSGEYVEPEVTEPEATEPAVTEPEATEPSTGSATLKNGDKVVIYAPAYNKALSAEKTGNYNVGVDITIDGGKISGYGETETWTVTVNNDGTYSFANGGKNISMGDQYTSMNLGLTYDDWALISLGNSLYNIQNTGRETFMEWYAKFSNWSTYGANNAAKDDQFQLSIYVIGEGILGEEGKEPEVTEPEVTEPETTEPSTGGSSATYTFSNYTAGSQYAENETHKLDDIVTVITNGCHFTTQLRIYNDAKADGNAIIVSAKAIRSIILNAGNKDANLLVYGSVDGKTWELIETVVVDGADDDKKAQYADYTVNMPAGTSYKYLKLDSDGFVGAQIRVAYMTIAFKE